MYWSRDIIEGMTNSYAYNNYTDNRVGIVFPRRVVFDI